MASTLNLLRPLAWLLVLLAGLMLGLSSMASSEILIRDTETHLVDGYYHLDARINVQLNDEVLEALHNGVSLTMALDIQVTQPRDWLWDAKVYELEQRYQLAYHALTERYVLTNLNTGGEANFATLSRALHALGTIKNLPTVYRPGLLKVGEAYELRVRARLVLEDLPSPLRVWAYLSPEWRMSSEWHTSSLQ